MKVQILKLSQISENPTNPRTITPEALDGLQDSILAFPKMQEIRPIIVDGINTALGGNMRIRALNGIAGMGIEEIKERLGRKRSFTSKPEAEQAGTVGAETQLHEQAGSGTSQDNQLLERLAEEEDGIHRKSQRLDRERESTVHGQG